MAITIQEITDREQWNTFLVSQPLGHMMQSYEWGELQEYLGGRISRIGALEDGRLIGSMLLLHLPVPMPVKLPGVHPLWLYCSRGPTIESLDSPALPALIEYARLLARKEHAVVLRVEPNISDHDPEQHAWLERYHKLGFRTNKLTGYGRRSWVLDIRPGAEQLLADFKMTWRQNVRIAQRKGVTIREGSGDADFDTYYDILKVTSERDDFFVHSKEYHKEMYQSFARKGEAVIYLAEHEGEALAAKMLIRFGDWCWDMFGGSINSKRNLKATYLIQYQCILWGKMQNCSYFDFRTIPAVLEPGVEMWGVYEFKKGFGGFSRLNLDSLDYVYRPLLYTGWNKLIELRHAQRHKERTKIEQERAARGQSEKKEPSEPERTGEVGPSGKAGKAGKVERKEVEA